MDRKPVVAGQFYPQDAETVDRVVREYLALAPEKRDKTRLAMVPHAGYPFSGPVAGITLGMARLADTVVLLGPNHTGTGRRLAVWPDGDWTYPGGKLSVDTDLAAKIIACDQRFDADTSAHAYEHSLEVLIPFLHAVNPDMKIVPVAVSEPRYETLKEVGSNMAEVLKEHSEPVSMVVSSDMSHFLNQEATKARDLQALEAVLSMNPAVMYETVRNNDITMCGILPMTLAMVAAKELGAGSAEVTAYTTSGEVTGEYDRVVGYAGVLVA